MKILFKNNQIMNLQKKNIRWWILEISFNSNCNILHFLVFVQVVV